MHIKSSGKIKNLTAGIIQMNSGENKIKNLRRATDLIRAAAAKGAQVIALPELFNWRGGGTDMYKNAEPIPGPTIEKLSCIASANKIFLLAGSILEKAPVGRKALNTSVLLNDTGNIIAVYRKIHLFQYQLENGTIIKESQSLISGDKISLARLPFCTAGLSICYDLRFPELYRNMTQSGASLFFVPSAFTLETGTLHWEVLLRARAIENQAFFLAPNQCGINPLGFRDYGHSMIVNPLGEVLGAAADKEDILIAQLNFNNLLHLRKHFPVLKHVRKNLFYKQ